LMRERFELTHEVYRGHPKAEFEEVILQTSDSVRKNLLSELRPRGDGCEKLQKWAYNSCSSKKYERLFGCAVLRPSGQYNIIVVNASQIKELESKKLFACGIGAVALGALGGVAFGSVGIGLVAANTAIGIGGAAVAGGLAIYAKMYSEKNNMPDVVCGYIIYEMERRNIFSITNNQIFFTV